MGWHSQPTAMVFFEHCKIPAENLVAKEGDGFKIALNALNGGRINIAACSLGGAKACLRIVKQYMNDLLSIFSIFTVLPRLASKSRPLTI